MASVDDLKNVVKEALQQRGTLDQLKGCIRAEVYKVIADENVDRPAITSENLLITELIKEFLEFNNYKYTASVLRAETGHAGHTLDRDFLAQELNILEDKNTSSVSLLVKLKTGGGAVCNFLVATALRPRLLAESYCELADVLFPCSGSGLKNEINVMLPLLCAYVLTLMVLSTILKKHSKPTKDVIACTCRPKSVELA